MSPRRRRALRVLLAVTVFVVLAGALAAPALASSGSHAALGFLGLPSVKEVVEKVVKFLFTTLADQLVPDWLKHAGVRTVQWLTAVPNPAEAAAWPALASTEGHVEAVAAAVLPLSLLLATMRFWLSSLSGDATHPVQAVTRTVAAAGGLVAYKWGFHNAVAFVNVLSHALLAAPVVHGGLGHTVGLLFEGSVLFQATGLLVALVVIVAVLLAVGLFVMKVAVLLLFALFFVAGPLALAFAPLPETQGMWRAWVAGLVALALIPVGWVIIFSTAGALLGDVGSFGRLGHTGPAQVLEPKLVALFAGIVCFWIALRWPFLLLSQLRGLTGGAGLAGAVRRQAVGTVIGRMAPGQRLTAARAQLRTGARPLPLAALTGTGGPGLVGALAGRPGRRDPRSRGSTTDRTSRATPSQTPLRGPSPDDKRTSQHPAPNSESPASPSPPSASRPTASSSPSRPSTPGPASTPPKRQGDPSSAGPAPGGRPSPAGTSTSTGSLVAPVATASPPPGVSTVPTSRPPQKSSPPPAAPRPPAPSASPPSRTQPPAAPVRSADAPEPSPRPAAPPPPHPPAPTP